MRQEIKLFATEAGVEVEEHQEEAEVQDIEPIDMNLI